MIDYEMKKKHIKKICIGIGVIFGIAVIGIGISKSSLVTQVTRDIDEYVEMDEFKGDSGLLLFPDTVEKKNVSDYYYAYRDHILLYPDIQLYLQCQYSPEDFQKECERLSSAKVEHEGVVHTVNYNEQDYVLPAYEAICGSGCCYEYVLVNADERTIDYVFLQLIDKEDIVFSKNKLPKTYGQYEEELDEFNIYAFPVTFTDVPEEYEDLKGYVPEGYDMIYQ